MPQDASMRPHSPRITLCHGAADATFAARLARDLLNMYGEESVQLAGPTEPDERADESDRSATSDTSVMVAVLSPEVLASGELDGVLHSAMPVIAVAVRECTLPDELANRRTISFADAWRYDLSLAELLDAIRQGSDGSAPAMRGETD